MATPQDIANNLALLNSTLLNLDKILLSTQELSKIYLFKYAVTAILSEKITLIENIVNLATQLRDIGKELLQILVTEDIVNKYPLLKEALDNNNLPRVMELSHTCINILQKLFEYKQTQSDSTIDIMPLGPVTKEDAEKADLIVQGALNNALEQEANNHTSVIEEVLVVVTDLLNPNVTCDQTGATEDTAPIKTWCSIM